MADDEIILADLSDEELVQQMHDDLYDGLKEEIEEGTNILLERGWTPYDILTQALVEGMRIVGIDFRDGILFVPEVLLAANAMKAGMAILRPLLAETGAPKMGKMVIGTVKGDIHDIGKNLVSMMMEGAGFEVVDLGINNAVEKYLGTIEEHLRIVTDGNRCYLPVQEQILVSSILRTFPGDVAAHLEGWCPSERTSIPTPKLVELADGVATYDERQDRKRPDWTYED